MIGVSGRVPINSHPRAIGGGVVLSAASPEAIWPTAFVAAAYILGQAIVDTWGN